MELSPLDKRVLATYQQHKQHGFSRQAFFRGFSRRLIVLVVCTIATSLAFLYLDAAWAAALVVGVTVGSLLRDVAYFRQTKRIWPLLAQIIDWDQVAALQGESSTLGTTNERNGANG